ncbi:(3S)-malyl-CoA thioesterase [Tepidamorphus gemmatus]|uniref:(3S)-malyl-CoA thioesterase n=1 Tax=Tepidamorphus gemmatus TaxID=747076 RepID=A0A4R3M5Y3_9HYPH|nr:thioesterase family protein [Tepidamorphus gemmatus]TCT08356.1 (3S)-malyl-CoA thioesterase [Tepidamorphus gemmatus]
MTLPGTDPIPAPVVTRRMAIEPGWIDYNGHLNMAYYHVLFDRGLDEAFLLFGLGPDYAATQNASFFTLEAHVCYLRELRLEDPVQLRFRLLDHDAKRAHIFMEMVQADMGWLAATLEMMSIHVDLATKRSSPWPAAVAERMAAMRAAHAMLPHPEQAGSTIGIRRG